MTTPSPTLLIDQALKAETHTEASALLEKHPFGEEVSDLVRTLIDFVQAKREEGGAAHRHIWLLYGLAKSVSGEPKARLKTLEAELRLELQDPQVTWEVLIDAIAAQPDFPPALAFLEDFLGMEYEDIVYDEALDRLEDSEAVPAETLAWLRQRVAESVEPA